MPKRFEDLTVREIALTGSPLTGKNFLFTRTNEKRIPVERDDKEEKLSKDLEERIENFETSVTEKLAAIQNSVETLLKADEPVEVEVTGTELESEIETIIEGLKED